MQWILTLQSPLRLQAVECNGHRESIIPDPLHYIMVGVEINIIIVTIFWDCRYVITIGAVTALCSTLMGSILPQVINGMHKVFLFGSTIILFT